MTTLSQKPGAVQFSPNGYPLNPATGRMYSRNEIVASADIPLPTFVDPANPPAYWQRRSAADLAAETKRIAAKNKRNAAARQRRPSTGSGRSSKHVMDNRLGWATLALVERVNTREQPGASTTTDPVETFVAETADPLAADPDETDGPRNMAESIMDLLGQDYRAARKAGTRIATPTAAESQRMLDAALRPDRAQLTADRRMQFGRGR